MKKRIVVPQTGLCSPMIFFHKEIFPSVAEVFVEREGLSRLFLLKEIPLSL